MVKVTTYLHEVTNELQKVTWPTRKQTWEMTTLVIIVSVVVGAYVGVLDFAFQKLMTFLISQV